MPNNLYNQMHPQNTMMQQFQSFQQNPIQYLMNKKINIPQELQNDPHAAVQYLMNNGKMSQEQFNRLSQIAQNMGIRLN